MHHPCLISTEPRPRQIPRGICACSRPLLRRGQYPRSGRRWLWPSRRHARRRHRAAAGLACGVSAVVATKVRRCWHRCFRPRPTTRARAGVREHSPSRVRARRRRRRRRAAAGLACGVSAVVATKRPCYFRRSSRSPCRRRVAAARRSSRRRSRALLAPARSTAAFRDGSNFGRRSTRRLLLPALNAARLLRRASLRGHTPVAATARRPHAVESLLLAARRSDARARYSRPLGVSCAVLLCAVIRPWPRRLDGRPPSSHSCSPLVATTLARAARARSVGRARCSRPLDRPPRSRQLDAGRRSTRRPSPLRWTRRVSCAVLLCAVTRPWPRRLDGRPPSSHGCSPLVAATLARAARARSVGRRVRDGPTLGRRSTRRPSPLRWTRRVSCAVLLCAVTRPWPRRLDGRPPSSHGCSPLVAAPLARAARARSVGRRVRDGPTLGRRSTRRPSPLRWTRRVSCAVLLCAVTRPWPRRLDGRPPSSHGCSPLVAATLARAARARSVGRRVRDGPTLGRRSTRRSSPPALDAARLLRRAPLRGHSPVAATARRPPAVESLLLAAWRGALARAARARSVGRRVRDGPTLGRRSTRRPSPLRWTRRVSCAVLLCAVTRPWPRRLDGRPPSSRGCSPLVAATLARAARACSVGRRVRDGPTLGRRSTRRPSPLRWTRRVSCAVLLCAVTRPWPRRLDGRPPSSHGCSPLVAAPLARAARARSVGRRVRDGPTLGRRSTRRPSPLRWTRRVSCAVLLCAVTRPWPRRFDGRPPSSHGCSPLVAASLARAARARSVGRRVRDGPTLGRRSTRRSSPLRWTRRISCAVLLCAVTPVAATARRPPAVESLLLAAWRGALARAARARSVGRRIRDGSPLGRRSTRRSSPPRWTRRVSCAVLLCAVTRPWPRRLDGRPPSSRGCSPLVAATLARAARARSVGRRARDGTTLGRRSMRRPSPPRVRNAARHLPPLSHCARSRTPVAPRRARRPPRRRVRSLLARLGRGALARVLARRRSRSLPAPRTPRRPRRSEPPSPPPPRTRLQLARRPHRTVRNRCAPRLARGTHPHARAPRRANAP